MEFSDIWNIRIAKMPPYYLAESELYRHLLPEYQSETSDARVWGEDIKQHQTILRKNKMTFGENISKAQKFIDGIQNSDWFKSSFIPNDSFLPPKEQTAIRDTVIDDNRIEVRPTQEFPLLNNNSATAVRGTHPFPIPSQGIGNEPYEIDEASGKPVRKRIINIPHPFLNNKLILLHELAHLKFMYKLPSNKSLSDDVNNIHKNYPGRVSHGPEFRGAYAHIIHHTFGSEAAQALTSGYRRYGLDWNFDVIHPEHRIKELAYSE